MLKNLNSREISAFEDEGYFDSSEEETQVRPISLKRKAIEDHQPEKKIKSNPEDPQ